MKKCLIILLVLGATACNHSKQVTPENKMKPMAEKKDTTRAVLNKLSFAVKKDLTCGMPVSAGISDTASYKGKLYGFCSAECKAEFLKTPETYLTIK